MHLILRNRRADTKAEQKSLALREVRGMLWNHALGAIRTRDLWLRRPTLYPAELRARIRTGGGISRVLSRSRGEDHFSGVTVSGALKQPTRDSIGAGRSSPLFGLAPGGVYHAAPVTGSAVRSYRTVSPLPVHASRRPSAVCSLLHFPSPRDARPLAGTVPCGARTFLDTPKDAAILTRLPHCQKLRITNYELQINESYPSNPTSHS